MAIGRNRNKITACTIRVFFFTVWPMAFVSPYLYYSANLGPILAFVYSKTTLFTVAYIWFCACKTTGRTNTDIDRLSVERVPVRKWGKWRTNVFTEEVDQSLKRGEKESSVQEVEQAKVVLSLNLIVP